MSQNSVHNLVNNVASKVAMNFARARKEKELLDAHAARKVHVAQMKDTMKWMPF
jgi:hypothetical protein